MPDYLNSNLLDRSVILNKKKKETVKYLFLDIDGVMNDYTDDCKWQEKRIQRLKKIIDETDAEIILSSSWRFGYPEFLEEYGLTKCADERANQTLKEFETLLHQYGLHLSGYTPNSMLNENGRPLEIRTFLLDKPNAESFVILDDSDFNWQWLRAFFVQTTEIRNGKKCYGLEDIHVEKAIAILNQFD